MERYSSGQRGQTVNLLASPSKVRILLSPLFFELSGCRIVAITSAFQADEVGSIPITRSIDCSRFNYLQINCSYLSLFKDF